MSKGKQGAAGFQPLASIFGDDNDSKEIKQAETITNATIDELFPFKDHPFHVRDDAEMDALVESIQLNGILVPLIVRKRPTGGYELIAGHRRKRAAEIAGLKAVPVDIRDVDDDTAILMMVNTNVQREKVLPSERAFSLKMMMDALNRQGQRSKSTSRQLGESTRKNWSVGLVAKDTGIKERQVHRYIRLTALNDALLTLVDLDKLPMNTGVELSYLRPEEQQAVFTIMNEEEIKPTMNQAIHLKEESQIKPLTEEIIASFLESKEKHKPRVKLATAIFNQYFPSGYSRQEAEGVIITLLEDWIKSK